MNSDTDYNFLCSHFTNAPAFIFGRKAEAFTVNNTLYESYILGQKAKCV